MLRNFFVTGVAAAAIVAFLSVGCGDGGKKSPSGPSHEAGEVSIVTQIWPEGAGTCIFNPAKRKYEDGDIVTVTAVSADPDIYIFEKWSENSESSVMYRGSYENPLIIHVNSNYGLRDHIVVKAQYAVARARVSGR